MHVLRTPDDRFADLPDFPFEPHYVELADGLRVHHLDEGPADAAPVLLMHGEPTWSFLYRKMIPGLVAAGHRCVAPDLVGFGRSDKPAAPADHSYARQVAWMAEALFDRLDLRDITLFAQDWGGLIGLRLVAADPDRFARVIVSNTGMPTGEARPTDAFLAWQRFAKETERFDVGRLVAGGSHFGLSDAEIAAYDAPFPDDTYKAAVRTFPSLVPTSTDDPASADNVEAWKVLAAFDRPFLCAFGDADAITKGGERAFIGRVAGAEGQPHTTIEGGGHFIQEDRGQELARLVADFIAATRSR